MDPKSPTSTAPPPGERGPTAGPRRFLAGEPGLVLVLLVLLAALAQGLRFPARWDAFDFYQFWLVGRAAQAEPGANVWSAAERERLGLAGLQAALREQGPGQPRPVTRHAVAASRRRVLETYSTPWLYTLFGATATGDYERDLDRFQGLGLAAFAAGLATLARLAGLSWSAAALLVTLGLSWFAPALSDVRVGNVNRLQLGWLALYLGLASWRRLGRRNLIAGLVLGLGVAFKPNLAFPALTLGLGWLALGRWRKLTEQVAGALGGALAAVALSAWWFGSLAAWRDWSSVLGELMNEYDHALALGNFSLARVLEDLGGSGGSRLPLALGLGLFALALWLRRRALRTTVPGEQDERVEDLLLLGLGAALSLLGARLAWLHYFVLVLPLAVVALRPSARVGVRVLGTLALLAVALEPLRDALRFEESAPAAAILVSGGTLLYFLVSLFDLAAPRAAPAV